MILPDVTLLVYAFLADADHHDVYAPWLQTAIAEDRLLLPDTVTAGFLRIATNRRIQPRPAPIAEAFAFATAISADARGLDHPRAVWPTFAQLVEQDRQIVGNLVPDAYLAAVAISHKAVLATRDRGFARFAGLRWFDPGAASV